jgi:hypothetical protein
MTPSLAVSEPRVVTRPQLPSCNAWPNPFCAATSIEFQMSVAQAIKLVVYDQAGRAVRTLIDAQLAAGQHDIGWNGLDGRGERLSSGVYFCRLSIGGQSRDVRITLIKP